MSLARSFLTSFAGTLSAPEWPVGVLFGGVVSRRGETCLAY